MTQQPLAPPTDPSGPVHDTAHTPAAASASVAAATTAPAPSVAPQATATPAVPSPELAAYDRAKPVFEKHCASCHTTGGTKSSKKALEHFAMDSYPLGGHHAHEVGLVVRKSLGAGGSKATMPLGSPGSVKGDELAAILAWADAFDAAHPPAAKDQPRPKPAPHKH